MTDPKPPELFAVRPVRSDFARRGPSYAVRRFLTVAVVAALLGGVVAWKFNRPSPTLPGEIPTIKAEGVYKQRPEQPGGLDIPHQDVQVYQSIDNDKAQKQDEVEHLLPGPETPQAPAAKLASAAPSVPELESLMPDKKIPTTATQSTAFQSTAVPAVASAASPTQSAPDMPTPPPAPPAVTSPAPTPAAPATVPAKTINDVLKDVAAQKPAASDATTSLSSTGSTAIQLAALQDPIAAEAMKRKLQSKYATILGANPLRLVKADLGTKGVYYRIQSQPMGEGPAKNICDALKNANAGCIIVRP